MTKENPSSGPAILVWNIGPSTGTVVLVLGLGVEAELGAELGAAVGSNDMRLVYAKIM